MTKKKLLICFKYTLKDTFKKKKKQNNNIKATGSTYWASPTLVTAELRCKFQSRHTALDVRGWATWAAPALFMILQRNNKHRHWTADRQGEGEGVPPGSGANTKNKQMYMSVADVKNCQNGFIIQTHWWNVVILQPKWLSTETSGLNKKWFQTCSSVLDVHPGAAWTGLSDGPLQSLCNRDIRQSGLGGWNIIFCNRRKMALISPNIFTQRLSNKLKLSQINILKQHVWPLHYFSVLRKLLLF